MEETIIQIKRVREHSISNGFIFSNFLTALSSFVDYLITMSPTMTSPNSLSRWDFVFFSLPHLVCHFLHKLRSVIKREKRKVWDEVQGDSLALFVHGFFQTGIDTHNDNISVFQKAEKGQSYWITLYVERTISILCECAYGFVKCLQS